VHIGVIQDGMGDRSSILILGVFSIISFLALIKFLEVLSWEFLFSESELLGFFYADKSVFVGSVWSNYTCSWDLSTD